MVPTQIPTWFSRYLVVFESSYKFMPTIALSADSLQPDVSFTDLNYATLPYLRIWAEIHPTKRLVVVGGEYREQKSTHEMAKEGPVTTILSFEYTPSPQIDKKLLRIEFMSCTRSTQDT